MKDIDSTVLEAQERYLLKTRNGRGSRAQRHRKAKKGVPAKEVIVIGGSAGAIEALRELLKGMPAEFPAAILVVIHLADNSEHFADIFRVCSVLPVSTGQDGERIERARVYLAPPKHHMLVQDGHIRLSKGPRENRHRPSVDALFRSAARAYRSRVAAVVLSGALDDGTGGAQAIKARGGVVVVQDPTGAMIPSMPASVSKHVKVDRCLPVSEMPAALLDIVKKQLKHGNGRVMVSGNGKSRGKLPVGKGKDSFALICPDCDGPLVPQKRGTYTEFQCQVGHVFTLKGLSEAHADALERGLWVALRRLEEQQTIQGLLVKNHEGDQTMKARMGENFDAIDGDINLLRDIISRI